MTTDQLETLLEARKRATELLIEQADKAIQCLRKQLETDDLIVMLTQNLQ